MNPQLVSDATKIVKDPYALINVISKRVRQLTVRDHPLGESGVKMGLADMALSEVIGGKLKPRPVEKEKKA